MGCFCQTGASPWSSAPHRADCGAAILHDLEHRFQRQRVDVASGALRPTRRSSPPACSTVRVMRVRRGARRLSWGTRWRRRRAALSSRFESVRTSGRRCSGSASCQRGGRSPIDPPQVCVERPLTPTVRTTFGPHSHPDRRVGQCRAVSQRVAICHVQNAETPAKARVCVGSSRGMSRRVGQVGDALVGSSPLIRIAPLVTSHTAHARLPAFMERVLVVINDDERVVHAQRMVEDGLACALAADSQLNPATTMWLRASMSQRPISACT